MLYNPLLQLFLESCTHVLYTRCGGGTPKDLKKAEYIYIYINLFFSFFFAAEHYMSLTVHYISVT